MRYFALHGPISIHAPAWGATKRFMLASKICNFNSRPRVGSDLHAGPRLRCGAHFNSRPRVGSDSPSSRSRPALRYFNSRPRVGSDRRIRRRSNDHRQFQFTPPRGERPRFPLRKNLNFCISIHAPAWGATLGALPPCASTMHFNSRPRVGSDKQRKISCHQGDISIHAPAWGATHIARNRAEGGISIHAPAWGATPLRHSSRYHEDISIHAPAWGATAMAVQSILREIISIHAPAWGATLQRIYDEIERTISIHAPAWGATGIHCTVAGVLEFQFTPPRGERLHRTAFLNWYHLFQFTPPRGERQRDADRRSRERAISIHAPAWGATLFPGVEIDHGRISIHAPAWGATKPPIRWPLCGYFNSRPRVGSDTQVRDLMRGLLPFQFTPPRGERHAHNRCIFMVADISIHAPAWGATRYKPTLCRF